MDWNIDCSETRQYFYQTLLKLVSLVSKKGLRMVIENPWNPSGQTYLQINFIKPTIVDKNRTLRGDNYVKPTAYWFINCKNTTGYSEQRNLKVKIVYKERGDMPKIKGRCNEARSMISPDYARNFICDFIIGKEQQHTLRRLFND